ncbi:ATP-binding protein [Frankia sp. R43]|uniref:sensor histidine kinase n=1 Tax=Frankia sp. R43 TaxID=269536 RepID=UPI0006CA4047|nr:ATP-binding protein [Frankia sp. R43]
MSRVTAAGGGEQDRAGEVALLAVLGGAFGATVLILTSPDRYDGSTGTVFSGLVGFTYLATGAVARRRAPRNAVGLLMMLVGIGWFAEDVQISGDPLLHTVGLFTRAASGGFLTHLVVAYPDGEYRSVWERRLVIAAYVIVFAVVPAASVFDDSSVTNLLLIHSFRGFGAGYDVVQGAMGVAVVVVLVAHWRAAAGNPAARERLAPVLAVGLLGAVVSALRAASPHGGWLRLLLGQLSHGSMVALPIAFLMGVLRVRLGRRGVVDLLVRLPGSSPDELQALLAKALRDPSLRVGFHRPDHGGYVDAAGRPLRPASGQVATPVERDGRAVAILLHHPALREDPHRLAAVGSAAALELDNQRLAAEVRAQLIDVQASRARLVAAEDQARRELERNLHDGAQQPVVATALELNMARGILRRRPEPDEELAPILARCAAYVEEASARMRLLARGIHPAADGDLRTPLEELIGRSPFPIRLSGRPVPSLPPLVATAAYFVVSESITNAQKHAHASSITIEVEYSTEPVAADPTEDDQDLAGRVTELRLAVIDDGVGGAVCDDGPDSGTGLVGIRDRIDALGGEFELESPPGEGTVVRMTLPVAPR